MTVSVPTVPAQASPAAEVDADHAGGRVGFEVHLENFQGPFDLLLGLIAKHKLDVTEVALSQVTVEFIDYIQSAGAGWDLGVATEFLVVASTLLELKAARLLPAADLAEEEDLALLETRDLLFARLLQYRAYKQAAAHLASLEQAQSRRFPRMVMLEPRFAGLLPELLRGIGPEVLAELAARALTPHTPPQVDGAHLHITRVSVQDHVAALRARLSSVGTASFRSLIADCAATLEVVARFLALLELHSGGFVAFDQIAALGELQVRWVGSEMSAGAAQSDSDAGVPGSQR